MNDKSDIAPDKQTAGPELLWSTLRTGLIDVMKQARTVWKGPDKSNYGYEEMVLRDAYRPIMWGFGCAFFSFFAFRVSGSAWWRNIRRGGVVAKPTRTPAKNEMQQQQQSSYLERKQEEQRAALDKALSVPIDLALSILIGSSIGLFLTDFNKLQNDFQSLPLLPGKSLVCENLCKPLEQALNQQRPAQDEKSLVMFTTFVQNCNKRQAHLDRINRNRQEASLENTAYVPYPGVPK